MMFSKVFWTTLSGSCCGLSVLGTSALGDITLFSYADFTNTSSLTVNSVVVSGPQPRTPPPVQRTYIDQNNITRKSLQLTDIGESQARSVWRTQTINVSQSFYTEFDFRMTKFQTGPNARGSDGIALVIQTEGLSARGMSGQGGGYAVNPVFGPPGISESVAIVLDPYQNANWTGAAGEHIITVQTNNHLPNSALERDPNNPSAAPYSLGSVAVGDFSDAGVHHARVWYDAIGHGLYIYYDYSPEPTLRINNFSLASRITLRPDETIPGSTALTNAWIGFTSATGGPGESQRHEVLNWSVSVPGAGTASLLSLALPLASLRRRR